MNEVLLTRDEFRRKVFERDQNRCVLCRSGTGIPEVTKNTPAKDAHHILERRLWPDGGYYLSNGASVCEKHHIMCETTEISVEEVRAACGIRKAIIPPHLYNDQPYDKWGNPILPNGQRLRGELFFDESVQKALKKGGVLQMFTVYVKYPRTYHLPWSENMNKDDRIMEDMSIFDGKRVVVTEKMDGENTSMYCDYIHARSIDGRHHPSRDWVKNFHAGFACDIPEGFRVCGENIFAKHSITYNNLPSYFMGFSIWNDKNVCLSWPETVEWFHLLGIKHVPVLFRGLYDEKTVRELWNPDRWDSSEGYVMRLEEEIPYSDFKQKVGKFVRKNHIQTVKHWMHGQKMEVNELAQT